MDNFGAEIEGMKELEKKLDRLVAQAPKKVVSSALRRSAKRTKVRLLSMISGFVVKVQTGSYLNAWKKARIRSSGGRGGYIRLGISMPTREEFGIDQKDKHFYPMALEYGSSKMEARPHIRPAVDNYKSSEISAIARDIKAGIEKEASKR
jgi:hypothetical protein